MTGWSQDSNSPEPALAPRLDHILQVLQSWMGRIDQHRHVAGLVLVLPHHLVRARNLGPRQHFAHAGIDATIEHELIGGRSLLEMGEMRALDTLLPHPDIARVE